MALSGSESLLVEAIKSMLQGKSEIGLANNKLIKNDINTFQYLHENIESQFGLDTLDSVFHESLCTAFHKVHGYKYITDPTFMEAINKEFKAMSIPGNDQEKARESIRKIIESFSKKKPWAEKDAGWNPQLDEIIMASQPQQFGD